MPNLTATFYAGLVIPGDETVSIGDRTRDSFGACLQKESLLTLRLRKHSPHNCPMRRR